MFKNASRAPSFKDIISCYKPIRSILNFFELILKAYTQQNHYIPGLGAPVLYMLPLLPLVDKRKDLVSGSQGSD